MYDKWVLLKNNKGLSSQVQNNRKQEFSNYLVMHFNEGHTDALVKIHISEDHLF